MRGAEKLSTFKGESSLKTWLFAIASNLAKDNLRGQKRWTENVTDLAREAVKSMTEILGSTVKFSRLPMFVAKLAMDKEIYTMFKWFNEKGFTADRADVQKEFGRVNQRD